jgi:tetratricopeptide (TPR) repeat protein
MKRPILFFAVILLAAGGAVAWKYGHPAYRHYKENRAVAEARAFMTRADYRSASVSARTALILNSNNVEACVIMADLSERTRSPQVLEWRRRVAELAPTLQNRLALASICLRTQSKPYSIAAQILEDLASSAQDSATYHSVAADLALRLGNQSEAATHFEAAARLDPTNQLYPVDLAVMRLTSTNQTVASAARATLERLGSSPEVGIVALRWFVTDCLRRKDLAGADRYSGQLLANPRADLSDRLDHLNILEQTKSPDFNAYLGVVQGGASTNAAEVYAVVSWMLGHGLVEGAQQWVTNRPAKLRGEQPVPLALVDCYIAQKDWLGLDAFLVSQNWRDLEFLRFAFLSRASEQEEQQLAAEARWRSAVREADTQLGALTSLLNMARSWKRAEAEQDLLFQIGQYFQRERWALRDLERLYLAAGNTRGLNKLYAMRSEYDSTNYVAQNNLAATSLLLNLDLPHARELARDLYQAHPDDAIIATTYAYSLHLQGKTQPGLAALEKLEPEKLELPSVALYYGVLLSATGDSAKAAKYLGIAKEARLLPEEKALLDEAVKSASESK